METIREQIQQIEDVSEYKYLYLLTGKKSVPPLEGADVRYTPMLKEDEHFIVLSKTDWDKPFTPYIDKFFEERPKHYSTSLLAFKTTPIEP